MFERKYWQSGRFHANPTPASQKERDTYLIYSNYFNNFNRNFPHASDVIVFVTVDRAPHAPMAHGPASARKPGFNPDMNRGMNVNPCHPHGERPCHAPEMNRGGFGPHTHGKPHFDGKPGCGGRPCFEGKPRFDGKPHFDGKPGCGGRPCFEGKPRFDGKPGCGGRPCFEGKPHFDCKPGCGPDRAGFRPTRFNKTEDNLVIEIELPGFVREDVKAEIADNRLVVTATRKNGENEETYNRSFRLHGVDKDAIAASLKDGLLTLTLPFVKPETKQVEIG